MQSRLGKISYRLKYRSTREMDIIFRQFWEIFKDNCTEEDLEIFEKLVDEDDFYLYRWISGATQAPQEYRSLVTQIAEKICGNRLG